MENNRKLTVEKYIHTTPQYSISFLFDYYIFIRININKDSYKEIAKCSTWIYTIASNLAKTELRKIKRRKTSVSRSKLLTIIT